MIISLLYLETLASLSNEEILIIIDEPELHLHPSLQEHFIKYLKAISAEKQILLSTHSPYFFKNCCSDDKIKLLITENKDDCYNIKDAEYQLNTFPWSPSWGEINYYAYNLPTIEFFNELYGYLHEITGNYTSEKLDEYFESIGFKKNKSWTEEKNGKIAKSYPCTIMTYIRHYLHHRENRQNAEYSQNEFEHTIYKMLKTLEKIKQEETQNDIPW